MKLITSFILCALVCKASSAERLYIDQIGRATSRLLLASGTVDDDILTDGLNADAGLEYQEVSRTDGDVVFLSGAQGWSVANLSAALELDTAATYANNFNIDRPGTWMSGTTRFNVTANLTRTGSITSGNFNAPTLSAALHTVVCQSPGLSTSLLSNNNSGSATTSPASALSLNVSTTGNNVFNSTIYGFLVDYDEAKSVVIYGGGVMMACKNLKPPFPNFPNDWSATIENTDVERGFTFVMREIYSQSLNKVRLDLHSFGTDRILVSDPSEGTVTIVTTSNGSCDSRSLGRMANWITQDDNATLLSTAELLHFTEDNDIRYVPGFVDVRGIPCEMWQTSVDISSGRFNASFDVEFYFPVNQWLVAREDYHRMLKRVYMNGTRNGEAFESYHEYINFRPRTTYKSMFDVCAISPYGHNCNCTDKLRKAAYSNLTQVLSDSGDSNSVGSAADAACSYGSSVPHGFISAQAGPYVGLTIIGIVAGALITGVAMYFYYRKRVGVRITDNIGHTKFTDAPGS